MKFLLLFVALAAMPAFADVSCKIVKPDGDYQWITYLGFSTDSHSTKVIGGWDMRLEPGNVTHLWVDYPAEDAGGLNCEGDFRTAKGMNCSRWRSESDGIKEIFNAHTSAWGRVIIEHFMADDKGPTERLIFDKVRFKARECVEKSSS